LFALFYKQFTITVLLLSMDDPSLQPININILHNRTPHSPVKSSLRTTFRGETASSQNNGKRVTFPSEGIHSSSRKLILVMDEANRKELNEVVRKVGSGSTWGRKERDRFNIPQQAVEVDAVELIGHEWFDFSGLTTTQQQSMFLTSWIRY